MDKTDVNASTYSVMSHLSHPIEDFHLFSYTKSVPVSFLTRSEVGHYAMPKPTKIVYFLSRWQQIKSSPR